MANPIEPYHLDPLEHDSDICIIIIPSPPYQRPEDATLHRPGIPIPPSDRIGQLLSVRGAVLLIRSKTATFTAEHLDAGESVVRADAFYLSAAAMLPGPSSLPAPSAAQKDVA